MPVPCVSVTGPLAVFVRFKPQTVRFIEIEIINLITNWDCIFLVIHFVLFMLRIVTNNLVILASAASQPPYENNVPCNFQGVPGQASLLSVHYIC